MRVPKANSALVWLAYLPHWRVTPEPGVKLVLRTRTELETTVIRYNVGITDDEALKGFSDLCRLEGIIPALESAHAVAYAVARAPRAAFHCSFAPACTNHAGHLA